MLLQTADSLGHSAKGQHWWSACLTGLLCAEGEHIQKGVSGVFYDDLSKHVLSVRAFFMYDFSGVAAVCCRHTFHQLLQQANRHTPRLHIVCVCDTAFLRLDSLSSFTSFLNSNCCVWLENISPHISVFPTANAISDVQNKILNTSHNLPILNFKSLKWKNAS